MIRHAPLSGARNMALDHALATRLAPGWGVLRLYGWDRPTISFGRNEPTRDRYDASAVEARGLSVVRRPTGGRAVLHRAEVTYAVSVPLRAFGGPRTTYRAINEALVRGLRSLGVPAAIARGGRVDPLDAGACFQAPAPGEITAGGRKLVGSAQARVGAALLQHGSVILEGDQSVVAELGGRAEPAAPPATLERLAPTSATPERVSEALVEGCRLAWGGVWVDGGCDPLELSEADRLEGERYARNEWTWRR